MVERFNRTLLSMLAAHCKKHPWDWEEHFRKVCMAYSTRVHASTGFSPFYLMYGRQARLPVDSMYGTTRPVIHQSPNEYAATLDKQLKSAFELTHKTAGVQRERQKHHYNQKVHSNSYNPGVVKSKSTKEQQ